MDEDVAEAHVDEEEGEGMGNSCALLGLIM
jgi:hypothetical protein